MSLRILIVDDEKHVIEGLKKLIPWADYNFELSGTATDALEAVELVDTCNPDVILTDIIMPGTSGIELLDILSQRYPHIKRVVLSGYDDFKYIREAIKRGVEDYILKPCNPHELISTLTTIAENLKNESLFNMEKTDYADATGYFKNNLLYRLVTADISLIDFRERARFLDFETYYNHYSVGVLKVVYHGTPSGEMDLHYKVLKIFKEEFQDTATLFFDRDGNIILLWHFDIDHTQRTLIRTSIDRCVKNAMKATGCNIFVTLGKMQSSLTDIYKSYFTAKALQNLFPVSNKTRILFIDHNIMDKDFQSILGQIFSLITAEKRSKELINFLNSIGKNDKEYRDSMLILLMAEFLSFFVTPEDKTLNSFTGILDKLLDTDDIYIQSELLYDLIVNRQEENVQSDTKTTIDIIIEYVEDNYMNNINLKTIAYKFNINPMYLGRKFYESTGKYFSNFLNSLRLNKAKKLLKTSNQTVKEVAVKTGFFSTSYFNSVFKKNVGMTPAEFRSKN